MDPAPAPVRMKPAKPITNCPYTPQRQLKEKSAKLSEISKVKVK